jgi:hypothetical protein
VAQQAPADAAAPDPRMNVKAEQLSV